MQYTCSRVLQNLNTDPLFLLTLQLLRIIFVAFQRHISVLFFLHCMGPTHSKLEYSQKKIGHSFFRTVHYYIFHFYFPNSFRVLNFFRPSGAWCHHKRRVWFSLPKRHSKSNPPDGGEIHFWKLVLCECTAASAVCWCLIQFKKLSQGFDKWPIISFELQERQRRTPSYKLLKTEHITQPSFSSMMMRNHFLKWLPNTFCLWSWIKNVEVFLTSW